MPYGPPQLTNKYGGNAMAMAVMPGQYQPDLDAQAQRQWEGTTGFQNQMRMLQQSQAPELQKMQMQQQHWGALFPYLQQALGGSFNQHVGGQSGAGPRITAAPIWDQGRQQQQVNAMRAQGAQETQGQVNTMNDRLAGSGFGAKSPLAQALETQMRMGNQASVAGQVRDFHNTAAQQNSSHLLGAQQAQEGQYASRMNEDIERRRVTSGYRTGLLGMLGQFM
jgi:hypothetical protein